MSAKYDNEPLCSGAFARPASHLDRQIPSFPRSLTNLGQYYFRSYLRAPKMFAHKACSTSMIAVETLTNVQANAATLTSFLMLRNGAAIFRGDEQDYCGEGF